MNFKFLAVIPRHVAWRGIQVLFGFIFLFSTCYAADEPMDEAAIGAPRKSVMGEATEAVVGRVFGVEGDASDIKYHVFELTEHSPSNAAVRSAVVPGWGQRFNNEKTKGALFFAATLGALFGSVHFYNQSTHSYDEYKAQGVKDSDLYDDYQRERTQAFILGSAAAVLWGVGMIDAYRNAYHPLYSQDHNMEVAFSDDGALVRFKKNF